MNASIKPPTFRAELSADLDRRSALLADKIMAIRLLCHAHPAVGIGSDLERTNPAAAHLARIIASFLTASDANLIDRPYDTIKTNIDRHIAFALDKVENAHGRPRGCLRMVST